MRRLALANLRANPTRFVATLLAVVVGTAFLGGALVLRDSLGAALEANSNATLQGVDVAVEPLQETVMAGALAGGGEATGPGTTVAGEPPGSVPADPAAGDPGNSRSGSGGGFGEQEVRLPASLLPTVEGVSGIGEVAPILTGGVYVLGPDGKPRSQDTTGALVITAAALNPYQVVQGDAPGQAGEVAVDQDTVDDLNLAVGQELDLATSSGPTKATMVGVVSGPSGGLSAANRVIVVSEADAFAYLAEGDPSYDAIYATAAAGTSPDDLAASVRDAVGDDYEVKTGEQLRSDSTEGLSGITTAISTALQGFAYLALFVGLFIIYNTFSIVVAQRVREFALLRAVGASSKQIKRSVRVEATIVGFVASAIGFGAGVLLFLGLIKLVPQFSSLLGDVGVRISPFAVIQVLVSGTIITVLSSIVPSWRAGRTKPIAALRESAIDTTGTNKARAAIGLAGIVAGVLVMLLGVAISQFWVVILGPPALFLGILIGGPVLAAGFTTAVGWVLRPLGGATTHLGVENTARNPRRAATTANALVIGVFLVVLVTAAGGAVRDYSVNALNQFGGPAYTVLGFTGTLPPGLAEETQAIPGVEQAAPIYPDVGTIAIPNPGFGVPPELGIGAIEPDRIGVLEFTVAQSGGQPEGSLDDLGPTDLVLPQQIAAGADLKVGDTVTLTLNDGSTMDLTIAALTGPSAFFVPAVMSSAEIPERLPSAQPSMIALSVAEGQTEAVGDSLESLTSGYTTVVVLPGNFLAQFVELFFNAVISSINALLSVAVVIALFGIVNTLMLSVTERRHEIGLLRSVGMTRRQLRATIRIEAMIVSLLGSLVGMAFGLFVAWCVTRPLFAEDPEASFSWPVAQMGLVLLLGVVIGVVSALVPAWRAGRIDILDALRTE
jgi:putative ABC transport system permease protein